MLKMYNATTAQIDSTEDAIAEIVDQLKDKPLLAHTVGIVACHPDYVEVETIQALRQALSFDFIGCSVVGSAANAAGGTEQLSLTVLTSDVLTLSVAFSDVLTEDNFESAVEKVYDDAKKTLDGDPAFAFTLCPIGSISGCQILHTLNKCAGGIPIFGTLACDTTPTYAVSYVFLNDDIHRNKVALLLIQGDFKPRFYTAALPARNIQQQKATVTESTGYLVSRINDMPLLDYLATIGIRGDDHLAALVTAFPLVVDYGDGTEPFANSMYNISEQGAACGSEVPVGSKISFAEMDYGGVIETCEQALRTALADVEKNGANGIIAIPCFSRTIVLSPNTSAEIKKSLEVVGDRVPFSLMYSGGEICPVYDKHGKLINRFHNLTYTLVVF